MKPSSSFLEEVDIQDKLNAFNVAALTTGMAFSLSLLPQLIGVPVEVLEGAKTILGGVVGISALISGFIFSQNHVRNKYAVEILDVETEKVKSIQN